VVAEAVPTRRRDEDGKLLHELELGEGDVGGSVSPGMPEPVGDAAVGKLAEPLGGNGASQNVSAQPFQSFAIVGVHDDTGVEAEALNARAVLSGDEVDIFQLDAIPEPHDRLAGPGAGCDAPSQ
jgi:hypothetical protein